MSSFNAPSDRRVVLAIDFDGTIVENNFPGIGPPVPYAFEVLKLLKEAGYILILLTCREDEPKRNYLTEAVEACRKGGITFDKVNEDYVIFSNIPKRKVFASIYIDDRNFGGFPGWLQIAAQLLPKEVYNGLLKKHGFLNDANTQEC